jgi:protein-S-isoprenylcysteine O-methyltransferase Ste14
VAAILIGGSGRLNWAAGWAFVLLVAAGPFATYVLLARKCPDLLIERSKIQGGTKSWDKLLAPLVALVLPLATWVVAALDKRYGWSGVSLAAEIAGLLLVAAGIAVMLWAMSANRFFAATVRIQTDRGHTVVSTGPYARVRHPGYVGVFLYVVGTPLALESTYAFVPAALCAAALVVRTALEDRTLRAELEGYEQYARRVRSRLIPAVW